MAKTASVKKGKSPSDHEQLNVRVPVKLMARIDHFLADNRAKDKRDVVIEALDAYLKGNGA